MTDNQKKWLIVGGIGVVAVVILLLLNKGGVITAPASDGQGSSSFTGPTYNIGGNNDSLNLPAPGAVNFSFNTAPAGPAKSVSCASPCNCPDVSVVQYGTTTDQAAAAANQGDIGALLTSLGSLLNNVLPPGGYGGIFGGSNPIQTRIDTYKAQQQLYRSGISNAGKMIDAF